MIVSAEVSHLVAAITRQAQPYALATVVRTVSATAAKAGAKAAIVADGTVGAGWIGGGGGVESAVTTLALATLAGRRPLRLDDGISSERAQEIALSILAEVVAIHRGGQGR